MKLMAADGIASSSVTKLIGSMYGKFTYICHKNQPDVGKNYYTWILWETVYR